MIVDIAPNAVVTAGTAGLGFETALGLARLGYAVTVVGRDPEHGARAVTRINKAATGPVAQFLPADLSSLKEVRALALQIAAEGPLQLLINNVGGMWPARWESVDGFEGSFALNHLSPYVLTESLLDAVKAGAPSRVVFATSGSIQLAIPEFDDVEVPGEYYGMAVTGRAKLANLAYTLDLAKRLDGTGVSVFAADAGAAATPNAAAVTAEMLPPPVQPFWDSIKQGMTASVERQARPAVFAATDPSLDGRTGVVIGPDVTPSEALLAYVTPKVTEAVLALTKRLVQL
jgi:NAD(P)-dependent dehydrogenase (short-subunit alcohol dehydrogenase family)